jgi:preprotein translocase subunit SecY
MAFLDQALNIWRIRDLRRRVLITIGLITVCRIGVFIPVPGIDPGALEQLMGRGGGAAGLLTMINMFTGGALGRGAIFALGIMPYISASIIFQLLANVLPSLEQLRKEGEAGRKKINQYTRIATVFICMFQGAVMIRGLAAYGVLPEQATASWLSMMGFSISNGFLLMAGTMLLMWIGEQIDEHGIGNGISMIIMVNILARLPSAIWLLINDMQAQESQQNAVLKGIVLLALFIAVVVAIILITRGERRIPVQQARHVRGPKVYWGQKQYMPLRVNQAGVMPLIFASALLQFPAIISQSASSALESDSFWHKFFSAIGGAVTPGSEVTLTYVLVYGVLIFFFCYFWTAIMFNPQEMSENLKDHGSFIPGIRPGKHTADYLEGIMNRVTLAGSFFLIIIALMPMLVAAALNVNWSIAGFYGGTSILIVVGVALDLVTRINQHLEMRRYSGFAAGAAGRRRMRRRR